MQYIPPHLSIQQRRIEQRPARQIQEYNADSSPSSGGGGESSTAHDSDVGVLSIKEHQENAIRHLQQTECAEWVDCDNGFVAGTEQTNRANKCKYACGVSSFSSDGGECCNANSGDACEGFTGKVCKDMDELTEFPGSCSGTSACKVSRSRSRSRSWLCKMVTTHPLIWAFYVLIVKSVGYWVDCDNGFVAGTEQTNRANKCKYACGVSSFSSDGGECCNANSGDACEGFTGKVCKDMDELTEFPGSCSGTSACKVSRSRSRSRSWLCKMVTTHPLIWAFYVLIVKSVMNVCKGDILAWPWIELTCAHDMVLQLH